MLNLILFMILLTQVLSDLSSVPKIKLSMISMAALNIQQSAQRLKLQVSNGVHQMLLMLFMLHILRLLS
jgi:hypothetical protein